MSVDYVFYLDDKSPASKIRSCDFAETSKCESMIRGTAFEGVLSIVIAHEIPEDSFIQEELPFKPNSKVIATIDLERYCKSTRAIITLTATLIESCQDARLYLNNEIILLSKTDNKTILHVSETDFWRSHIDTISFPFEMEPGF